MNYILGLDWAANDRMVNKTYRKEKYDIGYNENGFHVINVKETDFWDMEKNWHILGFDIDFDDNLITKLNLDLMKIKNIFDDIGYTEDYINNYQQASYYVFALNKILGTDYKAAEVLSCNIDSRPDIAVALHHGLFVVRT
jgi:hypothetical protein